MPKGTLNKTIVIGRLGQNPKIHSSPHCAKFATFTVATNGDYIDRNKVKHEHTDWHSFIAFGKTAEFIERYLKGGKRVYIESSARIRLEDTPEGKRQIIQNIVNSIEILDRIESDNFPEEEIEPDAHPQPYTGE